MPVCESRFTRCADPIDVVSVTPYAVNTRTPASIHDPRRSGAAVSPPKMVLLMFEKIEPSALGEGRLFSMEGVAARTVHEGARRKMSSPCAGTTVPQLPNTEKRMQAQAIVLCQLRRWGCLNQNGSHRRKKQIECEGGDHPE